MGAPVILQTYPRGLLGWLRQRIGGAAPDQVATILQPTIDAGRLYRDLRSDREVVSFDATANTTTTGWTVPSNQRWELVSLSCSIDIPGPAAAVVSLIAQSPTGEQWVLGGPNLLNHSIAMNRELGFSVLFPTGSVLLDPGTSIGTATNVGVIGGPGPWVGVLTASWYAMDI